MERVAKVQLTEEQAITLCRSNWWVGINPIKVAQFQLSQDRLCLNFNAFHKALEQALGRPVFVHELLYPDMLWDELHEKRNPPSLDELMAMLPGDKVIIVKEGNND